MVCIVVMKLVMCLGFLILGEVLMLLVIFIVYGCVV